ncbi:MAG TPA: hypothetical protein VHA76_15560 [Solirubrobacterales bacterium]|nr:hypothetical protein [Solirubrobacterales bacterium]
MSRRRPPAGRFALACLLAIALVVAWRASSGGAAVDAGPLVAEPFLGSPANTFIGASPLEAPGEVWATAGSTLARYSEAGGWETVAPPVDEAGQPVEVQFPANQGTEIARTTARGGVVAVGRAAEGESVLVVREPGGPLVSVAAPEEALLEEGVAFLENPLVAAVEGSGGATRALVTHGDGPGPQFVLSRSTAGWITEPICVGFLPGPSCTVPPSAFRVLAIEAGEGEAWLLGKEAVLGEGVELFHREPTGGEGGTPVWRQVELGPAGSLGAAFGEPPPGGSAISGREAGQPLTVTSTGVWVDAAITTGAVNQPATIYYDTARKEVTASWCEVEAPTTLCTYRLGSDLPAGFGRSFAWPAAGAAEPFGRRVVTGIDDGAILSLAGTAFERNPLVGGEAGSVRGAALGGPEEGWLGAAPPVRLTHDPAEASLRTWPVPFRRPLTAIAAAPGTAPGALGSEALAVGAAGEVARYVPGIGWEPEFLLGGSGKRATPNLRGVAWPEPGRAFAVGDGGAMWVWQKATGLWSADPAAPPDLISANFTAIAFDPGKPSRGYAVGKQGVLMSYGRTWTQEALPPEIPAEANFTSVSFAGDEALATWRYPTAKEGTLDGFVGGVIVNEGAGWKVDAGAAAALGTEPPQIVAGLPDGGALLATAFGAVYRREGPTAPWQATPGGRLGAFPVALAAVREAGQVRAIVSVAEGEGNAQGTDSEQVLNPSPPGQPPLLTEPYPLPVGGSVLRQTASGWRDEQHQAYPLPQSAEGVSSYDLPARPDPILAILVNGEGSEGWMVGGETGSSLPTEGESVQTADVLRYGAAATPPSNLATVPIASSSTVAEFAIGGDAQCAGPCADLTATGIGPDRSLRAAVGAASTIGGLRGFLYTGPGVAAGGFNFAERLGATLGPTAFAREERAYALRLGAAAGSLPTFAAPAETDLDASASLTTFQAAFGDSSQPFGQAAPAAGITPISSTAPGQGYYSFLSSGSGGDVRVIVLDYSFASLGETQRCWLANQLSGAAGAGTPAIVVGDRDLAQLAGNAAEDAGEVIPILVGGTFPAGCVASGPPAGASAYFFDYPGENRAYSLTSAAGSIPAFGSGTLGYVAPPLKRETDFVGAGGFLLAAVDVAERDPATNVAPVSVRLIPNIGSLALDALDGVLLRRSRPALFEGLARRPQAGAECIGNHAPQECDQLRPDPYVPIPTVCQGARCSTGIFPEYTFTSSNPDIADFVAPDPASTNPRNVLLVENKPVLDPQSGLLCAFNAGTTTVTVSAGGYSYSQKVTVLAGTVQQPCGTVPLKNRPAKQDAAPSPVAPPAPAPAGPAPTPTPTPPPPPTPAPAPTTPAPVVTNPPPAPTPHAVHPQPAPPAPPNFVPIAHGSTPVVPILPPPPAPAFQPTPPSGTSPVSAVEREEEEEEAYESSQAYVAVRPHRAQTAVSPLGPGGGGGGLPRLLPALALLAGIGAVALAGDRAGRRHRRRDRRRTRPAYQSNANVRR